MKAGHDLIGLIKFLGRDEWKEPFQDVLDEHFGAVLAVFDLEKDEVDDVIGNDWSMILWGCGFEDFITRDLKPDGRNLAQDYLERRGWKENARTRAYIDALRTSVMSLYEVSDINPGRSLRARDLIRGGEPILVDEGTATKSLKSWDKIAARIVPKRDGYMFAGGLLPFSAEATAKLKSVISAAMKDGNPSLDEDDRLRSAAPLFTTAWLTDVISKALGEHRPLLQNSDGEAVVFHNVRFPLTQGIVRKGVEDRLDMIQDLRRESNTFWNWLGDPTRTRRRVDEDRGAMSLDVFSDDGRLVLGNVELKERCLILTVNSAARAARGTALLHDLLEDGVLTPLSGIQTVDQMRASSQGEDAGTSDVPPEVATPIVHQMLDRKYREALLEPIGMIGDISPRAAVATAKGREKVADWLKFLENRSAGYTEPKDPMSTYDFGWMWRELGIEDLRR